MAKGSQSKEIIKNKILEIFEGSFLYDNEKEIRIPMNENGEDIEIKVTLTCAKVNVGNGSVASKPLSESSMVKTIEPTLVTEPTAEEKENVKSLLARLGL